MGQPLLGLLPPSVYARTRSADADPDLLYPAEYHFVTGAVARRQREFAAVRDCARRALEALGVTPCAIPRGPRGEPGWPAGVVGSMTHCEGMYMAAVASDREIHALGIDAESRAPLPEGVLRLVSAPEERSMLTELAADEPGVPWERLLFSAKEAVYKAWYPVTRSWLGFDQATVSFSPESGSFTVRLHASPDQVRAMTKGLPLTGRYVLTDKHLLTAVCVPAGGAPPDRK